MKSGTQASVTAKAGQNCTQFRFQEPWRSTNAQHSANGSIALSMATATHCFCRLLKRSMTSISMAPAPSLRGWATCAEHRASGWRLYYS